MLNSNTYGNDQNRFKQLLIIYCNEKIIFEQGEHVKYVTLC